MLFIYPNFEPESPNTVFPSWRNVGCFTGDPHLFGELQSNQAGVNLTSFELIEGPLTCGLSCGRRIMFPNFHISLEEMGPCHAIAFA
jgi:hypothetical protein